MTQPNADKLKLLPCPTCGWIGQHECKNIVRAPDDTRPAPSVGDDVVEAMAKVIENAGYYSESYSKELTNGAITAAEVKGYTLTKQDRVLPELPEGWFIYEINGCNAGNRFCCTIMNGERDVSGFADNIPATVLAAIANIAPPAGDRK